MVKIGVLGANGRMGRHLIEAVAEHSGVELGAATVRAQSPFVNIDAGQIAGIGNIGINTCAIENVRQTDANVWIDFTLPEALEHHIDWCVANKCNMVVGVTGLSEPQMSKLEAASRHIAIVYAANFSTGINVMYKLLQVAATAMADDADIEIIEGHHRYKKDAPSGTALALGETIAKTIGRNLKDVAVYGREGDTGERKRETIGFATVRAGDIVGDHTVLFADIGERIEITHKASSRMTFAKGAVRAAHWLADKDKGLFDMQDVLGLTELNL